MSDRRSSRRILQVHKIVNNKTPSYLKEKLPTNRRHHIRGIDPNTFNDIHCRTERYKKSFFPDAITSWNIFISHFSKMPSYNVLKSHVASFFRPNKKSIFGIHDSTGIRYLYQLRLSLSPLRSHKKRHNFIDTPSDLCLCTEAIEDTNHFLFDCPFYATQRAALATTVIAILLNNNLNHLGNQVYIYLYGHDSISNNENKNILLSTVKYIKDTTRFTT